MDFHSLLNTAKQNVPTVVKKVRKIIFCKFLNRVQLTFALFAVVLL